MTAMTAAQAAELTQLAIALVVWVALFAVAWTLSTRDARASDRALDDEDRRAGRNW